MASARTRLASDVTFEIEDDLETSGLSRADLAKLIGISPGRVSQILSGGENLTLRSLATVATALGKRFTVKLVDQ